MIDYAKMKSLASQIDGITNALVWFDSFTKKLEEDMANLEKNIFASRLANNILRLKKNELIGELNAMKVQEEIEKEKAEQEPQLPITRQKNDPVPTDEHGNPTKFIPGKSITFAKEGERMKKPTDE